jgi:hypothetical protein
MCSCDSIGVLPFRLDYVKVKDERMRAVAQRLVEGRTGLPSAIQRASIRMDSPVSISDEGLAVLRLVSVSGTPHCDFTTIPGPDSVPWRPHCDFTTIPAWQVWTQR